MSLKKCRALIRHLFLILRVRNARCRSLRGQDESSSRRVGLLFAALFRHRGRLLCILTKKEPQPGLRLSILHFQARAHEAPRLSKKRFEFAFRRISANH